ncbi:MAG: EpsI family protein [Gammaproteobacteria bacterium]
MIRQPSVPLLLAVALGGLVLLFRDSLELMLASWRSLKHAHGFLVPFLALATFFLHTGAHAKSGSDALPGRGAWTGLLLLLAGAGLQIFGELGAVYTLSQCGFILAVWGLLLSATGFRYLRRVWLALLCLLFMVPLPQFVASNLAALLQLLAVLPGVLLIRTAGFAVVFEGNVLDVGVYRIPVVEACSSVLMFPSLLCVALPAAVLYMGRWWWRLALLSSALFIPVAAGSLRIVITGLLARYRGAESAESFLLASGGAPLYLACAILLLLLIWWASRSIDQAIGPAYGLARPAGRSPAQLLRRTQVRPPLWAAVITIAALLLVSMLVSRPELQLPERQRFGFFPRQLGDWRARVAYVDPEALASLKLADHLSLIYEQPAEPLPVSLWVAWYDTQTYGASIHSPMACLPGAGWRVESLDIHAVARAGHGGLPLQVNRSIIALGDQRQLVYYWFAQRGRNLTSEYLLKWYLFQDSLLMQRSDGALIRLVTPLPDRAGTAAADARLTALLQVIAPVLGDYVPGTDARTRGTLLNKP